MTCIDCPFFRGINVANCLECAMYAACEEDARLQRHDDEVAELEAA